MTCALSAFTLYYAALPASDVTFKNEYIEYSYSPVDMNLVRPEIYEELPTIESKFDTTDKEDRAVMGIADENVINGIFRSM
jgi:hypothetical protein